jgi:hypothetical protein
MERHTYKNSRKSVNSEVIRAKQTHTHTHGNDDTIKSIFPYKTKVLGRTYETIFSLYDLICVSIQAKITN